MSDTRPTVRIRVCGEDRDVPAGMTILNALRRSGHPEFTKCGCRIGDCGECLISVRYPGATMPRRELACVVLVSPGLDVLELPFPWTAAFRGRAGR